MLPLTLGTAGHVDHGKTALIGALTGVETDRLAEEHERGISIVLGYAPLTLPSGRRLSVVDVPGHERFVRAMVAGATGIDAYLMTVAADDGVMPQTVEHAAVLRALDVRHGLVAVTKADLADPARARAEAAELLPGVPVVAVSARTGAGLDELRAALDTLAAEVPSRADAAGEPLLHVDRVFTIRGAGTVVTGTLWRGSIGRGDTLLLQPRGVAVRVRGVQVHEQPTERARAGQRVAVNLTGVPLDAVARGDVLAGPNNPPAVVSVLDAELELPLDELRVQVHHGTREVPAYVRQLDGPLHRLRLEQPLIASPGERFVIRWIAPPGTAGGGLIIRAYAAAEEPRGRERPATPSAPETATRADHPAKTCHRTGPTDAPAHSTGPAEASHEDRASPANAPRVDTPAHSTGPAEASGQPAAREAADVAATEDALRRAGYEPPLDSDLDPVALAALRDAGRIVRLGPTMHIHVEALAGVKTRVRALIEQRGQVTLSELRDELDTSRKYAQALLEALDANKVTLRRPDDARALRRRRRPPS